MPTLVKSISLAYRIGQGVAEANKLVLGQLQLISKPTAMEFGNGQIEVSKLSIQQTLRNSFILKSIRVTPMLTIQCINGQRFQHRARSMVSWNIRAHHGKSPPAHHFHKHIIQFVKFQRHASLVPVAVGTNSMAIVT